MKEQTILIVDDVPENIDILNHLLKNNYRIKAALTGEQALRIVKEPEPPDLILLDIMMPGMNGLETCRRLKSLRRSREIPVIFLTSASEMDSVVKGFEAGGVDYIVKPFSAVELATRVGTHLSLKAATEQLKNRNAILAQMVERKTKVLRIKNETLGVVIKEKDALLREMNDMEAKLGYSLDMLGRLYKRIEDIQEEERQKIAADVHDRMGQFLTAIKLNLFQLQAKAGNGDAKYMKRIEDTIALADEAIKSAQGIALRLRPDILDNLGFAEALRWYCRMMQESSGIMFALAIAGTIALDKEAELCLYRVIQEAFTNVIRHSRAKKCSVRIDGLARLVKISISDDGIGMENDRINDVGALGLYGMRKRLEDIQGEFVIAGSPGRGTTITLLVPKRAAE